MSFGFLSGDTVNALTAGAGPGRHLEMLVRCKETFVPTATKVPYVFFMLCASDVIDPVLAPTTGVVVACSPPIGFLLHRASAHMVAGEEVIVPIGLTVARKPSVADRQYWTLVAYNPLGVNDTYAAGKIDAFIGTGFSSGPRTHPSGQRNLTG